LKAEQLVAFPAADPSDACASAKKDKSTVNFELTYSAQLTRLASSQSTWTASALEIPDLVFVLKSCP
jgi:hypothetical protein